MRVFLFCPNRHGVSIIDAKVVGKEVRAMDGRMLALLGPGAPIPWYMTDERAGLLRSVFRIPPGFALMLRDDTTRPLRLEGQALREVRYLPAVYDGIVKEGVLTRHFRPGAGIDWRKWLPLLVFGGIIALGIALGLARR